MKLDDGRRLIDSNGEMYRAGWDEYDWFVIEPVEVYEDDDGNIDYIEPTHPAVGFHPDNVDQLIEAINEGRP